MSFLDDIIDFGGDVVDVVSDVWQDKGIMGSLVRTATLGFVLNQVSNAMTPSPSQPDTSQTNTVDPGVRLQVQPDTNHSIPVVYGNAYIGGIVTDAQLTDANQTMWYVLTICEKTGTLLDGTDSVIDFGDIYWNKQKVAFQSDGITIASLTDSEGKVNTDINGLVKIYLYNNGSNYGTVPIGYSGTLPPAYTLMPGWDSLKAMNNLVFALVKVTYNRDKNIDGLGDILFNIRNSMTQPGDCLYDYMTNTRYGAGIDPAEIYAQ